MAISKAEWLDCLIALKHDEALWLELVFARLVVA